MAAPPTAPLHTHTSQQQHELEAKVADLYADLAEYEGPERDEMLLLLRDRHARYLAGGLGQLPGGFISLDASRPWICYWVLHGLALLGAPLPRDIPASQIVAFLRSCQHPRGGYGGGPGQMAHLAPTYAAVGALITLGGPEALGSIDRPGMWDFLNRMAVPPEQGGGFRMHEGGECDVRSCYTAMAVATHLCLDVPALVAKSGMVDYIRRCQTYEGGIGGEPGNEAHGGYTFCGLAALVLAGCPQALDLQRLLRWAAQRQGWAEGGFNGRTNKLVDGCYSFWQGGVFPLLQDALQREGAGAQVPPGLDACCVSVTYPPRTAPSSWAQQQQQQQQELVVPDLPDLSRVQGPVELAEQEAQRLNAASEALAEAVLADPGVTSNPGPAAAAGSGGGGGLVQESRQQLVLRAQDAQRAAEYADESAHIAALSAAVLYPCSGAPGGGSGAAPSSSGQQGAGEGGDADDDGDGGGGDNPLFNTSALQLWILRACQQLKGGLRDKPGKSADYYHSCYCLSGLTAAQHIRGGGVLGAPPSQAAGGGSSSSSSNELACADPVLNIVLDKLQEARVFFGVAAEKQVLAG